MPNNSATGGYLSPAVASPPLEDADLDAQFQKAVVGITGLPGKYVRPRWQPTVPKQPEPSVNWCAIGVTAIAPDDGAYIKHFGTGDGHDDYVRHEDIELACSFYGPQAQRYATYLRDGLAIPQNVEQLKLGGIAWVECEALRAAPEFINQQWVKRYDLTARFRRQVKRTYGVLNIVSANPVLISDEIGVITN